VTVFAMGCGGDPLLIELVSGLALLYHA